MSNHQSFDELGQDQFQAVHAACEEFERGLQRDHPVSIESQLESIRADLRSSLFAELLIIELEWRIARNENPSLAEYQRRFSDHQDTVVQLFRDVTSQAALRFDKSARLPKPNGKHRPPKLNDQYVPVHKHDPTKGELPKQIGRYTIEAIAGTGAFGLVYKAYDNKLDRMVAIKVPHPQMIERSRNVEAYLAEARILASLRHPNIVPVHDVGVSDDYPCFFVLEYIEGETLAATLKRGHLGPSSAAELMATISEALHYAHAKRLTHRDVKPANILISEDDTPYLTDFGLALLDDDVGRGPKYAGTAAYMSPEQARGEGHRVDCRSDVFSLGAVLYETLTGRRPFRGDTQAELLHQVSTHEPCRLRQHDNGIPKELERICQRAMSKRAIDRYASASDLAQELRHFLATDENGDARPVDETTPGLEESRSAEIGNSGLRLGSDSRRFKIVPQGLRSFDEHDANFFVELLPGVRDRDGLPGCIRVWKTKIEQTEADRTFTVGLLYGPSGCGKSSLVKAGLLPRLASEVIPIYVEASAQETEVSILSRLRNRFPSLTGNLNLQQALAALRTETHFQPTEKVLIVIDQFEQWLHAKGQQENTELAQALRHCDGAKVQCLVMVRDDFWMAATHFMHELEVFLLDGVNSQAVDLFPKHHAKKVLAAFGQAFGSLPENADHITNEQSDFLSSAIDALDEDGKVVCVRLALFAQMIKDKKWNPHELDVAGGTTGVGMTFLEETFTSPHAPPAHRYHQQAARAVLRSLLPDLGTDLKGQMQSYEVLFAAAGYSNRVDFDELLHILDRELRLITPTEVERNDDFARSSSKGAKVRQFYQLTHDYLVPSVRGWLTQKQQETRRGRAELQLEDRAALWHRKQENSLLPSLQEYVTMRVWTEKSRWTKSQHEMMQKASRLLGLRWGVSCTAIVLIGFGIQSFLGAARQRNLAAVTATAIDAVQLARTDAVPLAVKELTPLPRASVLSELKDRFSTTDDDRQRLSIAFAMARYGVVESDFIVSMIQASTASEVANFHTALLRDKQLSIQSLQKAINNTDPAQTPRQAARLAVVLLHLGEADFARKLCEDLSNPIQQAVFVDEFPRWHGDLAAINDVVQSDTTAWRATIALAVGSIPVEALDSESLRVWNSILKDWYRHAPDSGTHGAADWALREWNFERPPISPSTNLVAGKNWHVNGIQMTMCKIPAGSFTRHDSWFEGSTPRQNVSISRDFLISAREVSVDLFHQFMEDPNYETSEKPSNWPGEDKSLSPTGQHPVQHISWYDAVMFCNWLSHREGLTACYVRTGRKDEVELPGQAEWQLLPNATGYRLPTEAEWEHACRAGTQTKFLFGDDESLLSRYAVFATAAPEPVGSNLPNRAGLFDCAGNHYEWCQDWYGSYGAETRVTDPVNENQKGMRVMRGGMYFNQADPCSSSQRNRSGPWGRSEFVGIRVARSIID